MNMEVVKLGDTSLHSETTGKYMYRHVLESSKTNKMVVVISAVDRYPDAYATDTLLSVGNEFLTRQEEARLVSTGEQLPALKICSELLDMGIRAYALPFFGCGILTDENYDYAKVLKLDHTGIREKPNSYGILAVSGFIGISPGGYVATLGRRGSDYNMILSADILDLEEVDIYTDVDGVYDKGPKLNGYAIKYDKLTYDEMLNMKSRVLHNRCVNYAKDHHIHIYLKGTFSTSLGTVVED